MDSERVITANRRRARRLGLALTAAVAGVGLAAVAVTAAPLGGTSSRSRGVEEFSIPMPPSGVLRILNAGGRVIVSAWDRDEVLLTVTKEVVARGSSLAFLGFGGAAIDDATQAALDALTPALEARDGGIDVSTLQRGPSDDVLVNYNYEVRMPRGSTLAVSNGSGPVNVSGVEGGVNVTTGNGDVTFDSVAGDVSARAENGAMSFSHVAGPLDAHTANGAILVDNRMLATLHPVTCRSDNGPIRLRAPQAGAYVVNATTLNGRVDAAGAEGAAAKATLHTLNGSITVDGI